MNRVEGAVEVSEADVGAEASGETHWCVSRSCFVMLTKQGVVLPQSTSSGALPLDVHSLRFLEQPDAGTGSVPPSTLRALIDRGVVFETTQTTERSSNATEPPLVADHHSFDLDAVPVIVSSPTILMRTDQGFGCFDHDGALRIRLTAVELAVAASMCVEGLFVDQFSRQAALLGDAALDEARVRDLTHRLVGAGLLQPFDPEAPENVWEVKQKLALQQAIGRAMRVKAAFRARDSAHEQARRDDPRRRIPVVPVHTTWFMPQASLGIVLAYAQAYEGGALGEHFDFVPQRQVDEDLLRSRGAEPAIYLFSDYVWSVDENMRLSALVKELNPSSITVHGGPHVPKYPGDLQEFFRMQPHVDVAVHGEGEQTLAELLDALKSWDGDGMVDLEILEAVPGLSYRRGDAGVMTASRERIADLDTIPSAILGGMFDAYISAGSSGMIVVESNRGCPYGCTFCDWGSATLSRIRKFSLDRVFAELEWGAKAQFANIYLADANFGIFERDVEIARHIVDLKARFGYPHFVATNYAKNSVKHLGPIIDLFSGAGIVAEGKLSLQSMDEDTLITIRRKNIKVEKYENLSAEFRKSGLPLTIELMMGLPGSTIDSFRQDVQACIDRDVRTLIYSTMLLPNSPMNDPVYREENGITASVGEMVKETATYTREEWEHMFRMCDVIQTVDFFGVLRFVALYVRAETGIRESAFYEDLLESVSADRERWPILTFLFESFTSVTMAPGSWKLLLDEVGGYVTEVVGVADDTALASALRVQLALLPTRGRTLPESVSLDHDFVAWHHEVQVLRDGGHRHDWPDHVAPLRSFDRGTLVVEDPQGICGGSMAASTASLAISSTGWELTSPVSRPSILLETADA